MTQKIFGAIMDNIQDITAENGDGHFTIVVETISGKRYHSWDEEIEWNADFVLLYSDEGVTFLPYSSIESVAI